VYAGTKHAVHAITEGLNRELHGTGVRATVIAPGVVETNYGEYIDDPHARAESRTEQEDWGLDPRDVAAQVVHVLTSPPDLHITEIALKSARQPPG
jgi:NADP-dependent 3-hydroxy acid dehydrogenase YdfG